MKKISQLMISCTLVIASFQVWGATASGDFVAEKSCEMYQSKRKLTNPDELMTTIGKSYAVKNTDSVNEKDVRWLQVHTDNQHTPDRWVEAKCGGIKDLQISQGGSGRDKPVDPICRIAGKFDSHVLAVSWQPAFCESGAGKGKPECAALTPESAAASSFTLHGLWPNKASCDINYGSCQAYSKPAPDTVKGQPKFCQEYPMLDNLSDNVRKALGQVMPSAKYGSCLQRHEWWKHGTCSGLSQDDYYTQAIDLTKQINASDFVSQFVAKNVGQKVTRDDFKTAFENSFGNGSFNKVRLSCKGGLLTELQIVLPEELKPLNIKSLLNQEQGQGSSNNNCSQFMIDPAA